MCTGILLIIANNRVLDHMIVFPNFSPQTKHDFPPGILYLLCSIYQYIRFSLQCKVYA